MVNSKTAWFLSSVLFWFLFLSKFLLDKLKLDKSTVFPSTVPDFRMDATSPTAFLLVVPVRKFVNVRPVRQ